MNAPVRLAAPSRDASRTRLPVPLVLAIGGAWLVAIGAHICGRAEAFGHDHLITHSQLPLLASLGLFLLAWQLMVAAMMLPSSLPLVRLFLAVSSRQEQSGPVVVAFLGGYAFVWAAFGAMAFLVDVVVHEAVHRTPWLDARPWLLTGGILTLAGAFQFSTLKDRCLDTCRHPGAYLLPRYRRGVANAFRLGRGHGFFCLGCCWALMLLMFAVGIASLLWMAALAAVMIYEKAGRHGERLKPVVGWVLLGWGIAVLANPGSLPGFLGGTG